MEYGIVDILKLFGSLVLFLYGMKLMSESLQVVAGDRMRSILSAMTSTRFAGIFTGLIITSIIQSSSATTVMLVSFVNAGLVTLTQSIGVIMGANIGTTVTAWLVSLLGFKVQISQLVLPLMAIALPLIFSKSRKRSNWGSFVIGFALLFIGLDFLKNSTPDINSNPDMMAFLSRFSGMGFWSNLIYLGIGTVLTMILQSSSATMALTLVMCYNGWLSFESAAAMVLGENIGTTITANLAAIVANTTAKRAARAHSLFNIVGVIIIMCIFHPFLRFVEWITLKIEPYSPFLSAAQTAEQTAHAIPIALSVLHSTFNISMTLLQVWFIKYIVLVVTYLVPRKEEDEEFKLKYISTGLLSTSELSLLQAKKEVVVFAERVDKMIVEVSKILTETDGNKISKTVQKIKKSEEIADQFELEITRYLTRISEEPLSHESTEKINKMLSMVSHLEEISDSCFRLTSTIQRKIEQKIIFNEDTINNLKKIYELGKLQIEGTIANINKDSIPEAFNNAQKLNDKLKRQLKKTRNDHYKCLKKKVYKCKDGLIYSDLYSELGKIGAYAFQIIEAIHEVEEEPVGA